MSWQNVEVVRRMIDAWNRRDLERILALSDPEIEYVNAARAVEPGTRRGHEGLAAVVRTQWEVADARLEGVRLHARDGEVIAVARVTREMPGTDARVANGIVLSYRLHDGRITRLEVLGGGSEYQQALEAAGLSE